MSMPGARDSEAELPLAGATMPYSVGKDRRRIGGSNASRSAITARHRPTTGQGVSTFAGKIRSSTGSVSSPNRRFGCKPYPGTCGCVISYARTRGVGFLGPSEDRESVVHEAPRREPRGFVFPARERPTAVEAERSSWEGDYSR